MQTVTTSSSELASRPNVRKVFGEARLHALRTQPPITMERVRANQATMKSLRDPELKAWDCDGITITALTVEEACAWFSQATGNPPGEVMLLTQDQLLHRIHLYGISPSGGDWWRDGLRELQRRQARGFFEPGYLYNETWGPSPFDYVPPPEALAPLHAPMKHDFTDLRNWSQCLHVEFPLEDEVVWGTDGNRVFRARFRYDTSTNEPCGEWRDIEGSVVQVLHWIAVEEHSERPPPVLRLS